MRQYFRRFTRLRLLWRCVALIGACWFYVRQPEAVLWLVRGDWFGTSAGEFGKVSELAEGSGGGLTGMILFFGAVWILLACGMVTRYFPSRIESMGCQKQFAQFYVARTANYECAENEADSDGRRFGTVRGEEAWRREKRRADLGALGDLVVWCACNGVVYWLYGRGIIHEVHMLLICLFYAVCDMVCILCFCPFRVLIMKNRCCTTCRIYNWDALMMMTPMLLSRNIAIQVLNVLALGLFLRWEWTWQKHPERFLEVTNETLSCGNCEHPAGCAGCVRRDRKLSQENKLRQGKM
ncbi:MAG: hypothetical protein Q4F28_05345 [Eubacteriales bacterium]|nr:hypothetical protein [Eubacteriales bacterium]